MGLFAFRRLRLRQEEEAVLANLRDKTPATAAQFTDEASPVPRRRGRRPAEAPTEVET